MNLYVDAMYDNHMQIRQSELCWKGARRRTRLRFHLNPRILRSLRDIKRHGSDRYNCFKSYEKPRQGESSSRLPKDGDLCKNKNKTSGSISLLIGNRLALSSSTSSSYRRIAEFLGGSLKTSAAIR